MSAESYLAQSEQAIRHLFDGLNAYDSIRLPSIIDFVDETGLVKMTKAENEAFLRDPYRVKCSNKLLSAKATASLAIDRGRV